MKNTKTENLKTTLLKVLNTVYNNINFEKQFVFFLRIQTRAFYIGASFSTSWTLLKLGNKAVNRWKRGLVGEYLSLTNHHLRFIIAETGRGGRGRISI